LIMNAFEKNSSLDYLSIFPKYSSPLQAYVPIITGCNNFCSYCVVPYARGREISRPAEEIISEVNQLAKKNYKTITLLGQNVNSYQYTFSQPNYFLDTKIKVKNINFPKLLDYLASNYPTINFEFISSHPKDFSDELIKIIAQHKNISREIHLPLQSGSDDILRAMNRPYTQKHYLTLIKKILALIPKASFTTDVIVGFPGETEEQFQETVAVFKKVHYNEAYINKYSPRPGTAAYSLGNPISWEEKKKRALILRKLVHPLH
ncbi:MAG TPA: MiaB/RimO family radical SAM methylthiotransferase, partial [Candidatus Moranbacteria bacterium]|nr:MiaB/RimO family radical SAM methylthiotransferase [Candidatus Moranbacteria bacterium]